MNKLQLDSFLPYHLSVASDLVSRALSKVYAEFGITMPEWRILAHLNQHKSLTPSQLGVNTNMDKARVSRALILLDKKGLINRKVDKKDKRVAHIVLTEAGNALFAQIEPQVLNWDQEFQASLPGKEYNELLDTLKRLKGWCERNTHGGSTEMEDGFPSD